MLQIRRVRVPRHPSIRFHFPGIQALLRLRTTTCTAAEHPAVLTKDSVRAGNVLYRYRGAGGTVVLLRHYCRQLYREREQPFQPGARADSVIRHSGGMLRNRDPETKKAGQMPRFAYLSCG